MVGLPQGRRGSANCTYLERCAWAKGRAVGGRGGGEWAPPQVSPAALRRSRPRCTRGSAGSGGHGEASASPPAIRSGAGLQGSREGQSVACRSVWPAPQSLDTSAFHQLRLLAAWKKGRKEGTLRHFHRGGPFSRATPSTHRPTGPADSSAHLKEPGLARVPDSLQSPQLRAEPLLDFPPDGLTSISARRTFSITTKDGDLSVPCFPGLELQNTGAGPSGKSGRESSRTSCCTEQVRQPKCRASSRLSADHRAREGREGPSGLSRRSIEGPGQAGATTPRPSSTRSGGPAAA